VAVLIGLGLPQLLATWRAALAPASAARRKLAVHVAGRGHLGDLEAPPAAGVRALAGADEARGVGRMQPQPQGRLPPAQAPAQAAGRAAGPPKPQGARAAA
jgi:hypothetical protein